MKYLTAESRIVRMTQKIQKIVSIEYTFKVDDVLYNTWFNFAFHSFWSFFLAELHFLMMHCSKFVSSFSSFFLPSWAGAFFLAFMTLVEGRRMVEKLGKASKALWQYRLWKFLFGYA